MKQTRSNVLHDPTSRWSTGLSAGLIAALVAMTIIFSGCGKIEEALTGSAEKEALAALEQVEAERDAAEARAAEEARARAEADARAEEEAEAKRAALETAERQLAEKERLLAEREAQLRRQQALQEKQEQLTARVAALEARESELFERERELEAREVDLAVAEDELEARAASAPGPAASESGRWGEDPQASRPTGSAGDGSGDAGVGVWQAQSSTATLQPGKVMEVEMLDTVSSSTHRLGDTFRARLVQSLRAEDGTLVVPAGADVEGRVVEVTPLKGVNGQASIAVEFTRITLASGESIEIRASVSELGADRSKDRKKIIGATVAGAILGRVLGGKGGENAAVGAVIGAAAGTAAAARTKGKDAVIPAGEMIALQLEEVVTVEVEMTGPVEP